jgi:hypothetical protein
LPVKQKVRPRIRGHGIWTPGAFLEDRLRVADLHLSRVCSARPVSSGLGGRANADGLSKRQRVELARANLKEKLACLELKVSRQRADVCRGEVPAASELTSLCKPMPDIGVALDLHWLRW